MKKLLYLKNQKKALEKQKFAFYSIEKPSGQSTSSGGSLTQRIEKKFNTSLNVETAFKPDLNALFSDLGQKAGEKNPALNGDSIRQNLADTLAPGKTLDDVSKHLQDNGCQTAAIMDGHLRFFAGPRGVKEITLSAFLKPMEMKIGGEGTVTGEYLLRRQEILKQDMQSLQSLRAELPELPSHKIS